MKPQYKLNNFQARIDWYNHKKQHDLQKIKMNIFKFVFICCFLFFLPTDYSSFFKFSVISLVFGILIYSVLFLSRFHKPLSGRFKITFIAAGFFMTIFSGYELTFHNAGFWDYINSNYLNVSLLLLAYLSGCSISLIFYRKINETLLAIDRSDQTINYFVKQKAQNELIRF